MQFYLLCLYFEITPTSCKTLEREMPFAVSFKPSINVIELNCMHETNKIELKLIEVDALAHIWDYFDYLYWFYLSTSSSGEKYGKEL